MHLRKFMTTTAAIAATTIAGAAVASADVVIPQTPTVQTSIAGDTFSATVTNTNTINSHCGLTVLTADLAPTTVFPAGFDIGTSNWDTHPDPVLPGDTKTYTVDDLAAGTYVFYAGCTTTENENSEWVNSMVQADTFTITATTGEEGGPGGSLGNLFGSS
ncbi:hypothetical protein CHR55_28800 [Rhodococcus qingshengii]|jgi:hypothetical protein|uniref:Uncharacterized protein n=2 Tax=Nocardiaceae TaxID=85025 RepID=A0A2A5J2P0_RHOSG|nr:hypothetical protein [Rhodococcus erythropolis]MBO8150616.1 hypothetical protein [Rhodococcus erythropolis]PCK23855.1 hypothetical protein CHR55_28800 [Rhodococcus qingshengii]